MGAPSFISAGSINYTGSENNTPTPPAHQANDILIAVCQNDTGTTTTSTSGWSKIAGVVASTPEISFFWKRASGSGTAGPELQPSVSTNDLWAIVYVIRGCITDTTPYEDATTDWGNATETTPDTATITTTDSDRLVCCFESNNDDTGWSDSPPPTDWTLDDDQTNSSGGGGGARFCAISIEKSTAGNVNATTIGTLSSGKDWGTLTLAFIPTPKKSAGFFAFFCESWKRHDKLWTPKLAIPKLEYEI